MEKIRTSRIDTYKLRYVFLRIVYDFWRNILHFQLLSINHKQWHSCISNTGISRTIKIKYSGPRWTVSW